MLKQTALSCCQVRAKHTAKVVNMLQLYHLRVHIRHASYYKCFNLPESMACSVSVYSA